MLMLLAVLLLVVWLERTLGVVLVLVFFVMKGSCSYLCYGSTMGTVG